MAERTTSYEKKKKWQELKSEEISGSREMILKGSSGKKFSSQLVELFSHGSANLNNPLE